jgi:hypothetical protein
LVSWGLSYRRDQNPPGVLEMPGDRIPAHIANPGSISGPFKRRPAILKAHHVLPVRPRLGWGTQGITGSELAVVLRSWEDRFGARLLVPGGHARPEFRPGWSSSGRTRPGCGQPGARGNRRRSRSWGTHICAATRNGRFWIRRVTDKKRLAAKLKQAKAEIMRRRHLPVPEQGRWLASVLRGHQQYYGVPGNYRAVHAFRTQVTRHWHRALERRSQKGQVTWVRMNRQVTRWLPPTRIVHLFPEARFAASHPW